MTLLVVAHLAQLGRREAVEAALPLRGRRVVVAHEREARPDARRTSRPVGLSDGRVGRASRCLRRLAHCGPCALARTGGAGSDLAATAVEQLLEVAEHALGLLPAAVDEVGDDALRVLGRHAPALDGVVHDLLYAVAREHHDVERADDALRDRFAHLGDGLTGEVEPLGCLARSRPGLLPGAGGLACAAAAGGGTSLGAAATA